MTVQGIRCFSDDANSAATLGCLARTGDWAQECSTGRMIAHDLAQRIADTDNVFLLDKALREMAKCPHAEQCGVRTGFNCALAMMIAELKR